VTLFAGHELATAIATAAALLAVLTGGQMHPLAWATLLAVPLGTFLKSTRRGLSTTTGGALALVAVLFGIGFTATQGLSSILLGAGYALCLLVTVRLLNRETPAHDLQLYALSLLLVLDAAALNLSWVYAPCFLAYTVAIVWGLTTRELKRAAQDDHDLRHGEGEAPLWRERGMLRGRFFAATGALAIVVLLGTLSLFVIFPRVGLGVLRLAGSSKSGFSNQVRLGGSGLISQDTSVVVRVTVVDGGDALPRNLYFRGASFDLWDGEGWRRSDNVPAAAGGPAARMPKPQGEPRRIRVSQEPQGTPYLFYPGQPSRVTVEPGPRLFAAPPVPARDSLGDLRLPFAPDELLNFELETSLNGLAPPPSLTEAGWDIPDVVAQRYLGTQGISKRATDLAAQWTAGATSSWEKVLRIQAGLGAYAYTLEESTPPLGTSPLDHFLFNRKAGHCEYFATALAMLSRAMGVPARVVGGYQGGAVHPNGGYLVLRQSDAHVWTEVYAPGEGWYPVDATPGFILDRPPLSLAGTLTETLQKIWEQYVIDFSFGTQISAAQGLAGLLARLRNWRPSSGDGLGVLVGGLAGGLLLAILAWLAWRTRARWLGRRVPGARLRSALQDAVHRVGGQTPPAETIREWIVGASLAVSESDRTILEAARDALEHCRYGAKPLSSREEQQFIQRVAAVRLPRQ
jgi:transglutaminase-like putative cysteine protease